MLSAVCMVESGHNASAYTAHDGGSPSIGACQIKYATAKTLGFRGTPRDLQFPETNAYYAAKYLRKQLDRYDNNQFRAIAAYNAGKVKLHKGVYVNHKYVNRVIATWSAAK